MPSHSVKPIFDVAFAFMSGSYHIESVLIGVKYRNSCRTLDVYLGFFVLLGQINQYQITDL